MGAFMSTLGFNQVFFFTLFGLTGMLALTIFIIQDSEDDYDNCKENKALLGNIRKYNLHKPSDDIIQTPKSISGATLRNMGSTCIEFA